METYGIKKRLDEYGKLVRSLENQKERLQRMIVNMQSPLSSTLTGMPKPAQSVDDNKPRQIYIKDELSAEVETLEKQERAEYKFLTSLILTLEDPNERSVITLKYIDLEPWEIVTFVLFGDQQNYEEQYDNYQRRCYRIHGRALAHLEKLHQHTNDTK